MAFWPRYANNHLTNLSDNRRLRPATFNLQPSNLQPSTFNLQPSNLQPSTF
ncbi:MULTISPECIES: hypothetical protein [Moorena]|uniref:hypothetical protein n=1 Tax=Moorena TaxID=1155738 RepID=UPI00031DCF61|nr:MULTISPECIES: hypothetical protein [Moorena]